MHRIDTPTAQKDKFGQGKNGFTNGDPATGTPSTHLNSDIFDALQEEPCTVIEKSGITLDKNRHDQLYQAIKKLASNAVDKAKAELIESLRQKLTKNENGADIPDKNQFIKNLDLLETVNLAKNAAPASRKINGKNLTQDVQLTAADVNAATQEMLRVEIPVGVPLPWPTESAPTGWFICNGQPFDKKKHPRLALAYPSGNLPDLRGEFIRGWDDGRGADSGRSLLSWQKGSYLIQESETNVDRVVQFSINDIALLGWDKTEVNADVTRARSAGGASTGTWNAKPSGGSGVQYLGYSRPRNIAFNYIVRAA